MEASGAEAKSVPAVANGKQVHAMVYASAETIQIGDVTFKRADLLLAIGLTSADLKLVRGEPLGPAPSSSHPFYDGGQ